MAARIDESVLTLPGHNLPFTGLSTRIEEIDHHHEARLTDIVNVCSKAPRSAADLLEILFRYPLEQAVIELAFGEACAHVNRLLEQGRIAGSIEADGIERYTAVATEDQ